MGRNDLITIGITCFNAQDTILRALNSAVQQDYAYKEIIIVDDCSTDRSLALIADFLQQHPEIRLVQHPVNKGVASARQTILEQAKGAFIAFFDDDDESLPDRLQKQYTRIIEYENTTGARLVACYASGIRIYPNGYRMEIRAIGSEPVIPQGPMVADYLLFYRKEKGVFYGAGTPTCSLMARKATFSYICGFDTSFRRVADIDFSIKLALKNGHFIGCQEQIFLQYVSSGRDKLPIKKVESEIQLAEKYKDYLQNKGLYFYARKWPLLRYYHFQRRYMAMGVVLLQLFFRYPVKTCQHFFATAPKRFIHERKIKKNM